MGLSRLDNFLKSVRGTIIYVDPNSLDSTDSIENQGNSLTRPFKTIQRALIEAARFSYQRGLNNDRFGKTTILLYPGDHIVDNRPGWIPDGENNFRLRDGTTSDDFPAFNLTSNFDLSTSGNVLYKLNSVHGGVIIPRGTSLVGLDLRKTKIRPRYVPNPTNDNIERTALFRVTGGCYFWQFSIFDSDPNGQCFIDYTSNLFVPNFSHHKLTCFEYADGVNNINISDTFQTYSTDRTDLDMYYEKVGRAYGQSSGRAIEPDYPSSSLDIQPKIDEYRIVGPSAGTAGISSIRAGDGTNAGATTNITVTTVSAIEGLDVDTAFRIEGITASGYSGQFVVSEKPSSTEIVYQVQNTPINPLPSIVGANLTLTNDTVTSASPYIFNISLRSVFGMCGLHADGNKATGFRSMVLAQFTGISLQKDDNAFVVYNEVTGEYDDSTKPGNETLSNNSRAIYKPAYRNFHIKTSNDSITQDVSIFAIGFAEHFVTDSGGDQSISNSNSNFGAKALFSSGFKKQAFPRDDVGYITHIIPPRQLETLEGAIEFVGLDVSKTIGIASTSRLYLYNETNLGAPPNHVIEGFRIGAKTNDTLNTLISNAGISQQYSAKIAMPNTQTSTNTSAIKSFGVGQSLAGINSISSNTLTLTQPHSFISGESIRIKSYSANLPDGLISNTKYYAITSGIGTDQIKIAKTLNDAINGDSISINNSGGILTVESRVSDKITGEIGHPIQYDIAQNNWYINVSSASTENNLYSAIVGFGITSLGASTPRTFILRKTDDRNNLDGIYRLRYVIPASSGVTAARPPLDGFVIQESSTTIGITTAEVSAQYSSTTATLSNENQLRNFRIIANASWDGTFAYFDTELPHSLSIGSQVEVYNIKSSTNTTSVFNSGYNKNYVVVGISSLKQFNVSLTTNPGTFLNDTSVRTPSLPRFARTRLTETLYIYRSQEIQKYLPGEQDGIYHLLVVNSSNKPTISPFTDLRLSQPIQNFYPQLNRDNPNSDPKAAISFALPNPIGQVIVDNPQSSITKEALGRGLVDFGVGIGLTNIISNSVGTAQTFYTKTDHGFNRITSVSVTNAGTGYGSGTAGELYNARLVGIGASTTGANATARITFNASGVISGLKIIDGGSAYGIGNTLAVVGVATTAGHTQAVVTVTGIYDATGECLSVDGVVPAILEGYNSVYRISGITVGKSKEINVEPVSAVFPPLITGLGVTATAFVSVINTGKSLNVSSLTYNNITGIGTFTTSTNHGLDIGNKIAVGGATSSIYNSDFIVEKVNSLTQFESYIGISSTSFATTGTIRIFNRGFVAQGGNVSVDNENISGRLISEYAGITTTISASITNSDAIISIPNVTSLNLEIGDYLTLNNEILRVRQTVNANPVSVFRGVYGTNAAPHVAGSVIRRIRLRPVELRRNSIIRASGHTFEYLGFGPGNYSTALPDRQDRQISEQEELLSISTKSDGGINVFTGMDDRGSFYVGNKKVNSASGQEQVFDSPVPTVTGEDLLENSNIGFDIINPLEISVSRTIRVEGGTDGSLISEFDGPVIFNNKITSNSSKGIEANSIFLQGSATVSRKYTVGVTQPIIAGTAGDVVYYDSPTRGGYIGWVYTLENDWYSFGNISISKTENHMIFDRVGIATTSAGTDTFRIGAGSSLFSVNSSGVGIGTTANQYKLNVNGNTNIIGTLSATSFSGNGSGLTGINVASSGWTQVSGGIYNTALDNVGIGTELPTSKLHVLGNIKADTFSSIKIAGAPVNNTTGNVYISPSTAGQARYHLYNQNGQAEWLFGQKSATDHSFKLSKSVAGVEIDYITINHESVSVGIGTTNPLQTLQVGAANASGVPINGHIFVVNSIGSVGIGTTIPRAHLDVEGHTKLKTYSENVEYLTVVSNVVIVNLSKAQSFICTATANITQFRLTNTPSGSTEFTIKIDQDSTGGRTVDIDTFQNSVGNGIPIYWPGGVIPVITPTANKTDIYSFKTFDGNNITNSGLYGVVVGQNFSN